MSSEKDTMARDLEELLFMLIEQVVTKPEALAVKASAIGPILNAKIEVAPADMGRVIGPRGELFYALRELAELFGRTRGREVFVPFLEDTAPAASKSRPRFISDPNWPCHEILDLVDASVDLIAGTEDIHAEHFQELASTSILVLLLPSVDKDVAQKLGPPLATVFRHIGTAKGRRIHLRVERTPL